MEEKFLCAIALFDEETNKKFKLIESQLAQADIELKDIPPHITMGMYVGIDEKYICQWMEEFVKKHKSVKIKFSYIGLFGLDIAFIAPHVSDELKNFHREFHEKYDERCGEIGANYSLKDNQWVPHITIPIKDSDNIIKALPIINGSFQAFEGEIVGVSLYEFHPTREIIRLELDK